MQLHHTWRYEIRNHVDELFSLIWGAINDDVYYKNLEKFEEFKNKTSKISSNVWHALHYFEQDVKSCKYEFNEILYLRALSQKYYIIGLIESAEALKKAQLAYQRFLFASDRLAYLKRAEIIAKREIFEYPDLKRMADELIVLGPQSSLNIIELRDNMYQSILKEIRDSNEGDSDGWFVFEGSILPPLTKQIKEYSLLESRTYTFPQFIVWQSIANEIEEYDFTVPSLTDSINLDDKADHGWNTALARAMILNLPEEVKGLGFPELAKYYSGIPEAKIQYQSLLNALKQANSTGRGKRSLLLAKAEKFLAEHPYQLKK